jgi:autoinducer 2-degrading protein
MHIVHVFIHVNPDKIEEFLAATIENARSSLMEPGVARFDLVRQSDDPTRFALFEVYHKPEDQASHKLSAHYLRWAELAEPLMAEPRTRTQYDNIFPGDAGWS